MSTIESKYRNCIAMIEDMYVENHNTKRRIRTLLDFIVNCSGGLDRCETIDDVRRVKEVMDTIVYKAWNDLSAIDNCNDSLDMFNENKEG